MCDPFNTSIGAALWDECHDLDPFMAEHYATNAQHELDRLAASQPFSARIAHVRRLHAQYSALAATAQLPEDFDFEEPDSAERVEIEHMAFVHPDCLALMSSRRENIMPSSSHAQCRSSTTVSANVHNSVGPRNVRNRRRSRVSSVENIVREDGFGPGVNDHHPNQELQQWAPPPPRFLPSYPGCIPSDGRGFFTSWTTWWQHLPLRTGLHTGCCQQLLLRLRSSSAAAAWFRW